MSSSQNYYAILQVKADADLDTIKRAYRKKIRRYHPDQLVASLSQAKRSGTASEIKKLELEIASAKQITQRINEAYAVLSDVSRRAAYDEQLSYERQLQYREEIRRQRMRHYDDGRRTVKSRPHHQNPNIRRKPQNDSVPWIMLVVLVVGVMIVSGLFSRAVTRSYTPLTTYVPRNPTSEGIMLARDLQATTNAEQATIIARSTIVFEASPTPRSSSQNELLGDQFMRLERADLAIPAYTDAIVDDPDNPVLYVKRARAYMLSYSNGDEEAFNGALDDYSEAIRLDENYAGAYLGRGLVYYELSSIDEIYAENARADLEYYLELNPDGETLQIQAIMNDLPEREPSPVE